MLLPALWHAGALRPFEIIFFCMIQRRIGQRTKKAMSPQRCLKLIAVPWVCEIIAWLNNMLT